LSYPGKRAGSKRKSNQSGAVINLDFHELESGIAKNAGDFCPGVFVYLGEID